LAEEGDAIIPGSASVREASLSTIIGGIIFGIGMIFGGGCASGTLTDIGEGDGGSLIVLFFFLVGSMLGVAHGPWWDESVFTKIGTTVYFPDIFGYFGSVLISLLLLLLIYIFTKKYEDKRKKD